MQIKAACNQNMKLFKLKFNQDYGKLNYGKVYC